MTLNLEEYDRRNANIHHKKQDIFMGNRSTMSYSHILLHKRGPSKKVTTSFLLFLFSVFYRAKCYCCEASLPLTKKGGGGGDGESSTCLWNFALPTMTHLSKKSPYLVAKYPLNVHILQSYIHLQTINSEDGFIYFYTFQTLSIEVKIHRSCLSPDLTTLFLMHESKTIFRFSMVEL